MNDEKQILLPEITPPMSRRRFVTGAAAGGALLGLGLSTNLSFPKPGVIQIGSVWHKVERISLQDFLVAWEDVP